MDAEILAAVAGETNALANWKAGLGAAEAAGGSAVCSAIAPSTVGIGAATWPVTDGVGAFLGSEGGRVAGNTLDDLGVFGE